MTGKKKKRWLCSPAVTLVLFAVAAVMLVTGAIGGASAALSYFSDTYTSRVRTDYMGVTLLENGERISWRDHEEDRESGWSENTGVLLEGLLEEGEAFQLGRVYDEALTVSNSGGIDQYVRVTIYKYWTDGEGRKLTTLSPELIGLNLVNSDQWILDEDSSSLERTVLYYRNILRAEEEAPAFCDTLKVDGSVAATVSQSREETQGGTVVRTRYAYDNVQFWIEAQVDAVQTHNAADAIWSAWGRRAVIGSDGSLSLE